MTNTNPITLTLTVDQTNAILHALGQLPFIQSADLIGEVKRQAEACLAPPQPKAVEPE